MLLPLSAREKHWLSWNPILNLLYQYQGRVPDGVAQAYKNKRIGLS